MSTRRERANKRKGWAGHLYAGLCLNCGGKGPHFIPPSFGDPGFYACEAIAAAEAKRQKPNAEESA